MYIYNIYIYYWWFEHSDVPIWRHPLEHLPSTSCRTLRSPGVHWSAWWCYWSRSYTSGPMLRRRLQLRRGPVWVHWFGTGTPQEIIRMQSLGDGWWWHRYVLCIFDALVQTWTSLAELEWSCHKVTSLGNSPKPPSCTPFWWIFRIQPDIYIYIYLNYVESINFCTRYHRGPLWRWNFLRPWHRHLRHKNCQALNAPEEVQWLDWWSLKNLRK